MFLKASGNSFVVRLHRFQHPGYSIQIMEQSLDKKLLLVYIAYTSTNQSCPSGYAGALITYKVCFHWFL